MVMTRKTLALMSCALPTPTRFDPAWELGQVDSFVNADGTPSYGYWYPNVGAGSPQYQDADYLFTSDSTGGFVRTSVRNTYSSAFAAQLWRRWDQSGEKLPNDVWFQWDTRFPSEITYDNSDGGSVFGFTNHVQLYRLLPGQTPFVLFGAGRNVQNDAAMKWHVDLVNRAVFDLPQITTPAIPLGQWITMTAHVILSDTPSGLLELWQGSTKIVSYTGPTIADTNDRYGISFGTYGQLQGPGSPIVTDYKNVEIYRRYIMPLASRFVLRGYGLASGAAPTNPLASAVTADSATIDLLDDFSLTDGTGAGQANVLYAATRTLAASATEDLDLNGTALQDVLGVNVGLARIKAIKIAAAAGNTNNVLVGAASANQWATLLNSTGVMTFRPGQVMQVAAGAADATGWTVTAGTGDLLKVANSGGGSSVTYTITIWGCNA